MKMTHMMNTLVKLTPRRTRNFSIYLNVFFTKYRILELFMRAVLLLETWESRENTKMYHQGDKEVMDEQGAFMG